MAPRVTLAATSGGDSRPALVHAEGDVAWLTDWWRARGTQADTLVNARCDASTLLSALGSSEVIHFSGHGHFDPESADRCGILAHGESGEGEVVSLARIAEVDCRRLRLATLFSCWSADSFLFPGQWAVSIPATLCRAGAGCVVAPLWEIDDTVAGELLRNVYRGLDMARVDEAVRDAQLAARSGPDGRMRSPFFWAGLQVYGNGARVQLTRGARWQR